MSRIAHGLAAIAVCLAVFGCAPQEAADPQTSLSADRPNVLVILVDDMGFGQLGVTGHPIIETPNIDALASNGVLFTQAYAGSTVCSPSRISLMTGKDAAALHSNSNSITLRPGDKTLAHLMSDVGYRTALFGKFGIGTTFGQTDPMAMGFQDWYGLLHNVTAHRQYPAMVFRNNKMELIAANVAGAQGAYAQRIWTDAAIDYVQSQSADTPWFVLLSYTSPHADLAAPDRFIAPYSGQFPETPYPGLTDPNVRPPFARFYPDPVSEPSAVQAGMVAALDAYVGEVMDALRAAGMADNTLVLFTSDNGPHAEGGADPNAIRAAGPYRGGKRDLYDGGIHVPMIAHWPARIPEGRVDDTPLAFADILPTLADLTDASPRVMAGFEPNGLSVLPVLLNPDAALPERVLYWEFARQLGGAAAGVGTIAQAARRGDWKAVRLDVGAPVELYDIMADPGETKDLSAQNRDVAEAFEALFDARLSD